jgi:hypothetical protein
MPCRPEEEFAQGPEPPNPVMPTESTGHDGAGHAEPDAENAESGSDLEAPQKRKRTRTVLSYEVVKRWVTGDRAELTEDEIKAELALEATKLMELSGQKSFPCHKALPTDLGCWKLCKTHVNKRSVMFRVYHCPMRHRCKCLCCIRVVTSKDYIELQRYGLHDRNSHDNDASKKLTYVQRVIVKEAAKTAPTLSGAALRRNLGDHDSPEKKIAPSLKRSVQHIVYKVRKDMGAKHLGSETDDSFGTLLQFAQDNNFSELLSKHNDPEDPYHFDLFQFLVLGHEFSPQRDIVRITLSSPWMLLNALRAIIAGWGFQLNGDVTGKVCRVSVDLLQFGVNSIPHKNHVLCLAIIPSKSESEPVYGMTWDDLRHAVLDLFTYNKCDVPDCPTCGPIMELISHKEVQAYLLSKRFRDQQLPVESAMSDNFRGWGNFADSTLGVDSGVCFPHATGNAFTFTVHSSLSNFIYFRQQSPQIIIRI